MCTVTDSQRLKDRQFASVTPEVTDKLRHPSIVEAVCELRFKTGVSYTIVPGAMRERLRKTYSEFEVLPHATLMGGIPDEATPVVPHHRFKRKNPNIWIQTGPRLLTINALPPYPHFEVYREEILGVLENYKTVAEPGSPVRIGLRYVNHLHSPAGKPHEITSYLRCAFDYPEDLVHPYKEFAARLLLPFENWGTLALAVAFPSQTVQGETAATLDLDFYWSEGTDFDLAEFPNWLQAAHDIVYKAFTSTVAVALLQKMRG